MTKTNGNVDTAGVVYMYSLCRVVFASELPEQRKGRRLNGWMKERIRNDEWIEGMNRWMEERINGRMEGVNGRWMDG